MLCKFKVQCVDLIINLLPLITIMALANTCIKSRIWFFRQKASPGERLASSCSWHLSTTHRTEPCTECLGQEVSCVPYSPASLRSSVLSPFHSNARMPGSSWNFSRDWSLERVFTGVGIYERRGTGWAPPLGCLLGSPLCLSEQMIEGWISMKFLSVMALTPHVASPRDTLSRSHFPYLCVSEEPEESHLSCLAGNGHSEIEAVRDT